MGLRRYPIGRWLPFIGYGVRDGPPPRNRPAGLPFFGPTPPNPRRTGNKNGKRSASRKKNAYFSFKLLIINHIN